MGRFLRYYRSEIVLASFVGSVIGALTWLCMSMVAEDSRLLKQCLDDGKKEYECVSMLRRDSPTVIHVGR